MNGYYFIHSPSDWSDADRSEIESDIETLGFTHDRRAAVGEGAGGASFETIIELVILPIATGLVSAYIYDLVKKVINKRPTIKELPPGLPKTLDRFRLVVHIEDAGKQTIISIDLKTDPEQLELAIKNKLDDKLKEHPTRFELNGDDWNSY